MSETFTIGAEVAWRDVDRIRIGRIVEIDRRESAQDDALKVAEHGSGEEFEVIAEEAWKTTQSDVLFAIAAALR